MPILPGSCFLRPETPKDGPTATAQRVLDGLPVPPVAVASSVRVHPRMRTLVLLCSRGASGAGSLSRELSN